MAVAHVGQTNAVNTGTTVSVTRSVTAGNLLVASLSRTATGTVSSISDGVNTWTSQVSHSIGSLGVQQWTAIAATTASITLTVTVSTSQGMRLQIEEASGSDTSTPVTSTGTDGSSTGTTTKNSCVPGIDVAVGGAFFGIIACSPGPGTVTYGSMTNNGSAGATIWTYRLAPSGLTAETGAVTNTAISAYAGCGVAVQPPAAGGGGQPFAKRWGGVRHNAYTRGGVW